MFKTKSKYTNFNNLYFRNVGIHGKNIWIFFIIIIYSRYNKINLVVNMY